MQQIPLNGSCIVLEWNNLKANQAGSRIRSFSRHHAKLQTKYGFHRTKTSPDTHSFIQIGCAKNIDADGKSLPCLDLMTSTANHCHNLT